MKYCFILWDVDGTLLDFSYSQRIAVAKCLEGIGVTVSEEIITRYSEINESWWKRLELGEVTKEQLLPGRFLDLFAEYGIVCTDVEAFRRRYQELLGSVYRYLDNSLEICRKLQGRYRQFAVTNGVASTQVKKLELSGFTGVLEHLFISEEMGAVKPHKSFFDACFAWMREHYGAFDKNSALIIGDSLSSDILGGCNAGIDTCWYNPQGALNDSDIRATYEIRSLKEVPALLGESETV